MSRIFNVSMPRLLRFINEVVATLPKDLNAQAVKEDDDIEVVLLMLMNNGVMLD